MSCIRIEIKNKSEEFLIRNNSFEKDQVLIDKKVNPEKYFQKSNHSLKL